MAGDPGDQGDRDDAVGESDSDALADDRARIALEVLRGFDETVTLADLAEEVAIRERDAPITAVSGETVADVYHSLYHTYVPRLAETDVLAYDQGTDMVQIRDDRAIERLRSADGDPD